MASFIESCNCKGSRPKGIIGRKHYSRPNLIAALLGDRKVARFVIAPVGFGKTNVVFEYARIIFDFKHVFWVKGGSPCFLRDLDSSNLLFQILKADKEAALIVFEDVPFLDNERAESFGRLMDELLKRDIEVIATSIPSLDTFTVTQHDRISLTGNDLLLNEEELSLEAINGRMEESTIHGLSAPNRIAGIIWNENGNGEHDVLSGLSSEHLPGDVMLVICIMLLLVKGSLSELGTFLPDIRVAEAVAYVGSRYPYLGIDEREHAFFSREYRMQELAAVFGGRIEELASHSSQKGREGFCLCIADVLLERGEAVRACSFLTSFASKSSSARWLSSRGFRLVLDMECIALVDLYDFARKEAGGQAETCALLRALAAFQLDDKSAVLINSRRVIRSDSVSDGEKLIAASLVARMGNEGESAKALSYISKAFSNMSVLADNEMKRSVYIPLHELSLVQVLDPSVSCISDRLSMWISLHTETKKTNQYDKNKMNSLLLGGSWIIEDVVRYSEKVVQSEGNNNKWSQSVQGNVCTIVDIICDHIDAKERAGDIDWFVSAAYDSLEALSRAFSFPIERRPSAKVQLVCRKARAHLAEQRNEYRKRTAKLTDRKRKYQQTHPDMFRRESWKREGSTKTNETIPMLKVSLFGGMEIRIGDEVVDPHLLSRMKTKTLLALLIINRGREISRDLLAEMLWPESEIELRRRNFYSVWSQLRRALSIEGSCPYLIRSQTGCRLDTRFVESDVHDFEDICRTMIFGESGSCDWEELYRRVCDDYSEKLMPCETENGKILMLREHYHMQLVDALISMAGKLCSCGEVSGSLWFAREAMRRDDKREDVYIALMEAQIAANQRSSALETYFACRKFLSEELGIDPSPRLVGLYRSIIETEEDL